MVLKVCLTPGCGQLTEQSRCARCRSRLDRRRNQASYYQTPGWRSLATACIQRDGNCLICCSSHRLTANHIVARGDGGPDTLENLMTMCGRCHSTYEADLRYGRSTDLRRRVDEIRAELMSTRDLRLQGGTA